MYKPSDAKQLLTDCSKLLISLEDKIDVTHGYDEILLLDEFVKMYPMVDVRERIVGEQFRDFILEMYRRFSDLTKYSHELPYMPFNIRSGVYSSIMGLMGEYISFAACLEQYQDVKFLQDSKNQVEGNDIEYYNNNHYITADIKVSTTDWTTEPIIKTHGDWFKPGKSSTRFHIVDIYNRAHFVINRSFLHAQFERHGKIVPVAPILKYSVCKQYDISHIVKSFL
jgi:hypothetical protein